MGMKIRNLDEYLARNNDYLTIKHILSISGLSISLFLMNLINYFIDIDIFHCH